MRDYKHLERDYARIAPETRNDGWDAAFWGVLQRAVTAIAIFVIWIAATWIVGAAFGIFSETFADGFDAGRALMTWLREIPR